MAIRKGDVVHIASASAKSELLVTDVGYDGRCSLAHIGATSGEDARIPVSRLVYVRTATDAEKRSTDTKWTVW